MASLLSVENLQVQFQTKKGVNTAVDGVSFSIEKGRILGIVGESGCGKSVTSMSILQLLGSNARISGGSIKLDGKELVGLPEKEMCKIRGNDIAMIFQDPMTALNPVFTVGDQIAESIEIHEHLTKAEAYEKAREMLELVGIPRSRAGEYPHQFSGGMRQRVVIAIALTFNPKLLIADEPTTALDVTIQAQVLDLMNDLKKKYGTSMILITHDLGIVAETCDQVAVMYAGRIVEQGTLEDIFNRTRHPYTEALFNSLPNIRDRKARLKPIPGLMPDPTNLPAGCAFAPRCPYATDTCRAGLPQFRTISPTHMVMCRAYESPEFHIRREDRS